MQIINYFNTNAKWQSPLMLKTINSVCAQCSVFLTSLWAVKSPSHNARALRSHSLVRAGWSHEAPHTPCVSGEGWGSHNAHSKQAMCWSAVMTMQKKQTRFLQLRMSYYFQNLMRDVAFGTIVTSTLVSRLTVHGKLGYIHSNQT